MLVPQVKILTVYLRQLKIQDWRNRSLMLPIYSTAQSGNDLSLVRFKLQVQNIFKIVFSNLSYTT